MIFGEKFISAKVESAKIVFGEIHFRRKWNWRKWTKPFLDIGGLARGWQLANNHIFES